MIFMIFQVPLEIRVAVGITVNILIILKALLNPIIYAARMSDIQVWRYSWNLRNSCREIFKHLNTCDMYS